MLNHMGLSDEYAPYIATGVLFMGDLAIDRGYGSVSSALTKNGSRVVKGIASETRGGTYVLRDELGNVVRSGRTNNLARRRLEHARDPMLKNYTFKLVHRTDEYAKQRGLEQLLHDTYNPKLNKLRPISPKNPRLPIYQDAAEKFLTGGK